MVDTERIVCDWLNGDDVGAACYYDVPEKRPGTFLTVTLTGGRYVSMPVGYVAIIEVDVWAETRREAAQLAEVVTASMACMNRLDSVFHVDVDSTYRDWDLDSDSPRYTIRAEITTCF